jgi:hypothetical protein
MGLDNSEENPTELLNGISGQKEKPLSVYDILDYTPSDLSPDEQQAYNNLNFYQQNPPIEKLTVNDYFPNLNDPIGKGTYSSSQIGSLTLFAPGGGVVPVSMFDARDRALAQAAKAKAKQGEDFFKTYKSPMTKLESVQPEVQKGFYDWLGKWIDEGKRKYGDNVYSQLPKNIEFQRGLDTWNTVVKYNDQIADDIAKFEEKMKDKNFVASPETMKMKTDMKEGLFGMQDPFSDKSKNFVSNWSKYRAMYGMDMAINDAIDKSIAEVKEGYPTANEKEFYDILTSKKETFYPKEKIRGMAEAIYKQRYADDPSGYFSVEDIEKELNNKLGKKVEYQFKVASKPKQSSGAGDVDYTDTDYKENFNVNYNPTRAQEAQGLEKTQREAKFDVFVPFKQNDAAKTIRVPVNEKMVPLSGGKIEGEKYIEGKTYGVGINKIYKKGSYINQVQPDGTTKRVDVSGEMVPEGVDANPSTYDFVPGTIITTQKKQGNMMVENQYFVPTEYTKNTYNVKDKRAGQIDASDVMVDMEQKAAKMNEAKNASVPKQTPKPQQKKQDSYSAGQKKTATNQRKITSSKIDPSTLVVGETYIVNGQERVWDGSKLILKR